MIVTRHHGFTLLEVLIGVLIFGIAALGITLLQAKLIKATIIASQRYEASVLAEGQMESLRNFSKITDYNAISSGSNTYPGKNATYSRSWVVTTTTIPSYKNVIITVRWTSSEGVDESVVISSTIAGLDPMLSGKAISPYTPITP